jgi:hypothetical protein
MYRRSSDRSARSFQFKFSNFFSLRKAQDSRFSPESAAPSWAILTLCSKNNSLTIKSEAIYTKPSELNRVLKDTFQYTCNRLASGMATEKAETDRVPVTLALSTIAYLEKLVRQGTHGTSVPGVARTLIEEGIRLAIKDGLLSIRDNGKA